MSKIIFSLISAWHLVGKRSLAHWKLLSAVVIGVLMASTIMASTVMYYDSLKGLALKNALSKLTNTDADIIIKADRGPTSYKEYARVSDAVDEVLEDQVAWLLKDRLRGGKTSTFFLTSPGNEKNAGDDNSRAYFAFRPRLLEHITLLPGSNPPQEHALSTPNEPLVVQVIVPFEAAQEFEIGIGDQLSVVPYWDDIIPYAKIVVSGIFERNNPKEEFWRLDDTVFHASHSRTVRTIPFYISEKTFMDVLGTAFRDLDSTYGWLLDVETNRLNAGNASSAHSGINLLNTRLSTDLSGYHQITSLDETLADYHKRLFFSKLPIFVILTIIAVVILYYVVTLSSLMVEQQQGEISLLRSRGASSYQILAVFVVEGSTISILAIIAAPLLATIVIGVMGFTPAFSGLSGGERLPVSISSSAYMMSTLGGILSFMSLIIPAIQASHIGVTKHRQQSARPLIQPFYQRYYLDVMLLILSIVLFRQLDEQGSLVATGVFGETTVDQILLAIPALILIALALVLLRLYPLAIRFISGDSPDLLNLSVTATLMILGPSVAVNGLMNGDGSIWIGQIALLAILGGTYWTTCRTKSMPLKIVCLAIQTSLVSSILNLGPSLPLGQIFDPILIAIVPAQVGFIFLRALGQRAPVGVSMGLWQMARHPVHYARLSLLLILMAGLGIFAASFGGTLKRSFEERVLYSTGADIRIEGIVLNNRGTSRPVVKNYEEMPGVQNVSPAFRGSGSELSHLFSKDFVMFSVDGDSFEDVAWFRDDFSDEPMTELLDSLVQDKPPLGIALPVSTRTIMVRVKPNIPHPSVIVDARIKDFNGRYFTYPLGRLTSFDWQVLEAQIPPHETGTQARGWEGGSTRPGYSRRQLRPIHPLTLVSLSVHEMQGISKLRAGSMAIDEINVRTLKNEILPVETFDDISEWSVLRIAPEAISDGLQSSATTSDRGSNAATFIWTEGNPLTSRGIFHGPPTSPLPVLASKPFLNDTGHEIGENFRISVSGHKMPIQVVGSINYFPTLDTLNKRKTFTGGRFLISDLTSLSSNANLDARSGEFKTNEIWISTNGIRIDRDNLLINLLKGNPFQTTKIHDRESLLAESRADPLVDAGWTALLFIAFSAILILSILGFLVHAYVSFRARETEFGLMRTIGFSMKQLVTLVWLEQTLVIAAGLALGTWVGGELGSTIMPFLGHDDEGNQVVPPFVMEVSWSILAITYATMTLVFASITMGVIWFIRRISLQRVMRLGEM